MGRREIESAAFGSVAVPAGTALRAALHVADRAAAEHPHPLDELMPRLSGRLIGRNPAVAEGVLELLAALGLPTTAGGRRALQARARAEGAGREAS